jgi:hypothetical protein
MPHLTSELETVDDWGCNSPHLVLSALARVGLNPLVRGFDVLPESEITSALPDDFDLSKFVYHKVEPLGRKSPVEANTADAAFFNNVVFRAQDSSTTGAEDLICKGMHGVKLGGIAVWGSNFADHGRVRHWIPWVAQMYAARVRRLPTVGLRPPAQSMFFPQLVDLLSSTDGLEVVEVHERASDIKITELEALLQAVKHEILRTNLPKDEPTRTAYEKGLEVSARRLMASSARRGNSLHDISHTGKVIVRKTAEITP